jgi:VIT1/CCC1 family predicted Fe2+/Mn2+ transporter
VVDPTAPRPPLTDAEVAEATLAREAHTRASGARLEEAVFGSLDGVITAIALGASVAGVLHLDHYAVFLTITAAAVAGSLSMFVGALLSARALSNLIQRERAREEREVEEKPDEERQEVRDIYLARGFTSQETEILVNRITSDKKRWVDMMMRDELGLTESDPAPFRHGAVIGGSYLVASLLPALPFLSHTFPVSQELWASLSVGGIELVIVGILQAHSSGTSRLRGAGEILLIGLGAALAVFLITVALQPGM